MKVLLLTGSPRKDGNTNGLVGPFVEELAVAGASVTRLDLPEMHLLPCQACRGCQSDWEQPACVQRDDMDQIFAAVLAADLVVLATPIYSFYCTPPMKIVLDRLVYGLCKYYGESIGPSLWGNKAIALLTTCGYPAEKGADLWEEGVRRYCKHCKIRFAGQIAFRHRSYRDAFLDAEKIAQVRAFARRLVEEGKF